MSQKNKLDFLNFSSIPIEKWKEKIYEELKVNSDKNLSSDFNGIEARAFYTRKDLDRLKYLENFHQQFKIFSSRRWEIREVIKVSSETQANKTALSSLKKGADAIAFDLQNLSFNEESIDKLLKDIPYNTCPVHFYISENPKIVAQALAKNTQSNAGQIRGSINYDPISIWMSGKELNPESFNDLSEVFEKLKNNSQFKILTINNLQSIKTIPGPAEEIAYTLVSSLEYIDRMTESGIPLNAVLSKIEFSTVIGKNYFIEIAKLRAMRLLWAEIIKAFKSDFQPLLTPVHCQTADFTKSLSDPYKNILHNTTEAMSAIIGGCDSLSIIPFDKNIKEENEFSSRISRNISLILKEEAGFDKVIDPSAGSYYIENLTHSIAQKSWSFLTDIQKAGGFIQACKNGLIKRS